MNRKKANYRIIGAYDSETTNYSANGNVSAFPVLHQLGLIDLEIELKDIYPENVETCMHVHMYRHSVELYEKLDELVAQDFGYIPVICCHNLSFDMYGLSQWLLSHDVAVLAKSARKPITFRILDDNGQTKLVIWDTLIFTQQSLERMGKDCGYAKAVGKWDYDLIRTPETPLTPEEAEYASKDIYTLISYLGWWCRRNNDIDVSKLALNVTTKTGIVRERRKVRFGNIRGKGKKYSISKFWYFQNRKELPKTDDELFMMQAAMRGGFTFCASNHASQVYDLRNDSKRIYAFDATSQHPAQIVSHMYPESFHPVKPELLDMAFKIIELTSLQKVLDKWFNPFNVAFNACFKFNNIRPKANSVFERNGILPLASARFAHTEYETDDNGDRSAHDANRFDAGYHDSAVNPVFAFGKLVSASEATLFITELTAWEIAQCYDFDDVHAISGYLAGRFCRPTDMAVVSVMQFYKAKNEFKKARSCYYSGKSISNDSLLRQLGVSDAIVDAMIDKTITDNEIESAYLSLKADLNALFGIEASNEFRRATVMTGNGIEFTGDFGLQNAPKNPKAWYQFGQRIVGWSRIAQICTMLLMQDHVVDYINGDTDSIKVCTEQSSLQGIENSIAQLSRAIDRAKRKVCARVRLSYPRLYDSLQGIGHYVLEFETDAFCASWNKAYCTYSVDKRDDKRHFSFTLAGIPANRGINQLADELIEKGYTFAHICNVFLGYNVTFAYDILKLNARKFPEWGSIFFETVTDYQGNSTLVCEPEALAIYPMSKTINDTRNKENMQNMHMAFMNNPDVNIGNLLITENGILDFDRLCND